VSRQHHFYGANHLHYLTKSIYRRVRVFDSDRFRLNFTRTLDHLRAELGFRMIGYVLMPEHFHLLFQPWPAEATPETMKEVKQGSARSFSIVNRQSSNRQSADWPWSSWRFYHLGDASILAMDRTP
jgi:REP element-mobilizing transposase RayT